MVGTAQPPSENELALAVDFSYSSRAFGEGLALTGIPSWMNTYYVPTAAPPAAAAAPADASSQAHFPVESAAASGLPAAEHAVSNHPVAAESGYIHQQPQADDSGDDVLRHFRLAEAQDNAARDAALALQHHAGLLLYPPYGVSGLAAGPAIASSAAAARTGTNPTRPGTVPVLHQC